MQKTLIILLVILLSLTFASCGKKAVVNRVDDPAKAISPATFSYDEQKKREIDLRPTETFGAAGVEPIGEAASGAASDKSANVVRNEPGTLPDESTSGANEKGAASVVANTGEGAPSRIAANGTGNAPSQTTRSASEQKKGGEAKDSLGFFSEKKPVDVSADNMEGLEKGKIIVFKGNVIVRQENPDPAQTLSLFSDKLTARMNQKQNEIDKADAEGNVKMIKGDRTATCKQAFFDNGKGEVILKGDVVVFEEGGNRLTGETVTYYIKEDRFVVQGQKEKRARVIVTPK